MAHRRWMALLKLARNPCRPVNWAGMLPSVLDLDPVSLERNSWTSERTARCLKPARFCHLLQATTELTIPLHILFSPLRNSRGA